MSSSRNNDQLRFKFGKNWQSYLEKHLSDEVIEESKRHLLTDLKRDDLHGMTVLDIGCGSGIHSLAAILSGAKSVTSFDYDHDSVVASQDVFKKYNSPENWNIMQGSVLDDNFMYTLGKFDLVYAWGVLHHTGDVWSALLNTMKSVKDNGILNIGLYDPECSAQEPEYWFKIKQNYNRSGYLKRMLYEWWYILEHVVKYNPLRIPYVFHFIKDYKKKRGMNFMHDVKDWLGGWPMEYCRLSEVIPFVQEKGFLLTHIKTGEVVTEYVFEKNTQAVENKPLVPADVNFNIHIIRTNQDIKKLSVKNKIYIYGAGKAGSLVKNGLNKYCNRDIEAFITTSGSDNVPGYKVYAFDEIKNHLDDVTIVVASKFYGEISCLLARNGINRFYNAYPYVFNNL